MYAAANSKTGAGGVSQSVGKEFVASDSPGKLPEKVSNARSNRMYSAKTVTKDG